MPTGPRVRGNSAYGIITDNPLTVGATTFNSAGLQYLPVVTAAHAVVTLDPLRQFGEPEIVVVTAHTASATVATITRGAYGTIARSHPVNTVWVHAPINEDVISILTSATRPADPYRGEGIFETDTNRFVARSTADTWQQNGLFFDPPACRVFHNVNQSITDQVETTAAFNAERYDTDSMHDTVTNNSRITFNTAGLYLVTFLGSFPAAADYGRFYSYIRLNGTIVLSYEENTGNGAVSMNPTIGSTTMYKFVAGDYVEIRVFQDNSANVARNLEAAANRSPEFAATWLGRGN